MKDREAEEEKAYKYQDGIHEKKNGSWWWGFQDPKQQREIRRGLEREEA